MMVDTYAVAWFFFFSSEKKKNTVPLLFLRIHLNDGLQNEQGEGEKEPDCGDGG